MPDISACVNHTCPKKDDCYRFRLIWGADQTYVHFEPDADGICEQHIVIDGRPCAPKSMATLNALIAQADLNLKR